MLAYKIYRQEQHTGYEGDNCTGNALIVFPETRMKVVLGKWHLAVPGASFAKNIRGFNNEGLNEGFGENDIGLEKLAELTPEEWIRCMQEIGFSNSECGCLPPVEVDAGLVDLLKKRTEGTTEFDKEIDKQLKGILFN